MRALVIFIFFLSGCASSNLSLPHKKSSNQNFFLTLDSNSSSIDQHPEYPLVFSSHNSAWEISLWLMGATFFICISPSLSRWICAKWRPFWCGPKKDLTEEDD